MLPLPLSIDLVTRYGGKEIADVAVPRDMPPLTAGQMEAAARGDDLDDWPEDERQSAEYALARLTNAITRASTEAQYYLRFRAGDEAMPPWWADDLQEIARYHLYDSAGNEDSTVRLRYQDVIRRLKALMEEDAARGNGEAGSGGSPVVQSNQRIFTRRSLRRL